MLTVAALFIIVACGGSGGGPSGSSAINGTATNGSATNGSATNGSATNGSATNGSATNGSATNGSSTNGSSTNGGSTTGSSTPSWKTFAPTGGPTSLNEAGDYVGYLNNTTAIYSPSLTATASSFVKVSAPAGLSYLAMDGVNSLGQIAGGAFANDSLDTIPYYWSSPSATPVPLTLPTGVQYAFPAAISKGGVIVCRVINSSTGNDYYIYPSPTAKPIKVASSSEYLLGVSISDAGNVVLNGTSNATQALIFQPPYTGTPITITSPSGSSTVAAATIGPDGTVVANDATGGYYMLPNQYTKPKYIGANYFILAVNSKEHMCGFHNGGGGNDNIAIWWPSPTGSPVTVKDGSSVQYTAANVILDNDSLVVGDDYGNSYYLLASTANSATRRKR